MDLKKSFSLFKNTCLTFICQHLYNLCLSPSSPGQIIMKTGMKILGILLIVFFYSLVTMIAYSYFFDVCQQYYFVYRNRIMTSIMIIIGLIMIYNIIYNFTLAAFSSPGDTNQFKEFTEQDYDKLKQRLNNTNLNYCKKCQTFKPERAHHCSICGKCIFRMDHHCPWINNCVGHFNQRYFLLMIFYLDLGLFIDLCFQLPMLFNSDFQEYKRERSVVFIMVATLTITLVIVLAGFNIWNWYLALKGNTAIEFWGKKLDKNDPRKIDKNYENPTIKDNLLIIFGSDNFISVLMPSIRKLPFDGIKWSVNTSNTSKESEGESLV